MNGMFHDEGVASVFLNNVAAGSERAGFSGPGVACHDTSSFTGNEAHACLAGYWFDFNTTNKSSCAAVTDFRAWKIHMYGIYGEVQKMRNMQILKRRSHCRCPDRHFLENGFDPRTG